MKGTHPVLVVPCRRGGIPYLTPEQARDILEEEERVVSLCIFDAHEYRTVCASTQRGFTEFCGLADFKLILTVRSSLVGMHASAPASDTAVSGDHGKGRLSFHSGQWLELITSLRPTMAVTLYDSVPLHELNPRRRKTTSNRSLKWANAADSLQHTLGCELIKPYGITGEKATYVYAGNLCQNELIEQYYCHLREAVESHQVMAPAMSVGAVLMALMAGVTLIECPLPWVLAERGVALTLNLKPVPGETPRRYESQIDLNDPYFAVDIGPLSPSCVCYTCKRHNRAYLHHLLTVQEMNSDILLVIHNLSSMVQLVRQYRRSSAEDRHTLLSWIFAQL
uniref:Queuine tRNA-ribosyltransferase accessory subunit 2 n=1 Tax=Trypanosoma congolense (strain IL3000) TaxID=1068625 RepID=F9W6M3_TRYCI|nr:unnamed protein product [Trypanosoma congolense IL3000]